MCLLYLLGQAVGPVYYEVYFAEFVSYLGERGVLCVGNG